MLNKIWCISQFWCWFLAVSLFNTQQVFAVTTGEQVIEMASDTEATASASAYNLNRIKVIGDRISSVIYNDGEASIAQDNQAGEIYLRKTDLNNGTNSMDLFIKTENGHTYKLILQFKDTLPAVQIFIKSKRYTLTDINNAKPIRREEDNIRSSDYLNFQQNFEVATINLFRHMAQRNNIRGVLITNRSGLLLSFRKDVKIEWEYSYALVGSKYSGELSRVTNITNEVITLTEDDFMAKGVRAVKLDKLILQPKESCYLYQLGGDAE